MDHFNLTRAFSTTVLLEGETSEGAAGAVGHASGVDVIVGVSDGVGVFVLVGVGDGPGVFVLVAVGVTSTLVGVTVGVLVAVGLTTGARAPYSYAPLSHSVLVSSMRG